MLSVDDEDEGQNHTFRVTSPAGLFDVRNTSILVSNASFNFENLTQPEFNISIHVEDDGDPIKSVLFLQTQNSDILILHFRS